MTGVIAVLVGLLLGNRLAEASQRRADYKLWEAVGRFPQIVNTAAPTTAEIR